MSVAPVPFPIAPAPLVDDGFRLITARIPLIGAPAVIFRGIIERGEQRFDPLELIVRPLLRIPCRNDSVQRLIGCHDPLEFNPPNTDI
jgi:hypothetical protein